MWLYVFFRTEKEDFVWKKTYRTTHSFHCLLSAEIFRKAKIDHFDTSCVAFTRQHKVLRFDISEQIKKRRLSLKSTKFSKNLTDKKHRWNGVYLFTCEKCCFGEDRRELRVVISWSWPHLFHSNAFCLECSGRVRHRSNTQELENIRRSIPKFRAIWLYLDDPVFKRRKKTRQILLISQKLVTKIKVIKASFDFKKPSFLFKITIL